MSFKLTLTILILYVSLSCVNTSFCFWNTGCPYKYFASKTPYNSVRGDIRDSVINVKGCEPISIWAVYRHGKRYPDKYNAQTMEDALIIRTYLEDSHAKGNCSLCAQDIENLKKWPKDKKLFKGLNELSDEGYQEILNLAERLRKVFPNLLSNIKHGEYTFGTTTDDELKESARAFVEGIGDIGINVNHINQDMHSSPVKCEYYQQEVKSNSKPYEEAIKYRKSPEYLAARDRMQRRAGLDITLTDDNVTALYDLCRFTWSDMTNTPSPWCALFTSEDLQVLEYLEDLKHYYKYGYGTSITKKFGYIPLTDLLKGFRQAKEGDGKKITAYFSHGTAVDMTITALGIFKDEKPLTATKRYRDRKWRSSKLSNFSANVMVVLNKCEKNNKVDYNVVFYLNEQPIKTICDEAICPWKEFEEKMQRSSDTKLDSCEIDGIL